MTGYKIYWKTRVQFANVMMMVLCQGLSYFLCLCVDPCMALGEIPFHWYMNLIYMALMIKPVRLNGSFDSKCTRPETSHSYQSFTILINTSTGINVALNNLRFKWHNNSRHQTGK